MDLLVNSDGVVHRRGLNSLPLNHRLDCHGQSQISSSSLNKRTRLMDVVVLVLVDVRTEVGSGPLHVAGGLHILVHRPLLLQLVLMLREHLLLLLANDRGRNSVDMLGVQDLLVGDRLHAVLVVVDVALPVDSLGSLDLLDGTNVLLNDLGSHLGADLTSARVPMAQTHLRRVSLARALEEVFNTLGYTGHFALILLSVVCG